MTPAPGGLWDHHVLCQGTTSTSIIMAVTPQYNLCPCFPFSSPISNADKIRKPLGHSIRKATRLWHCPGPQAARSRVPWGRRCLAAAFIGIHAVTLGSSHC